MKREAVYVLALLLISVSATNVSGQQSIAGVWTLWSIDGLPVDASLPSGYAVELDGYAAGDLRWETTIVSRRLSVLPGGDFRQDDMTVSAFILSPDAVERLTGVRPSHARRFEQLRDQSATVGTWRIAGDSVFFERELEAVAGDLVRLVIKMADVSPSVNLDSLRAALATVLRSSQLESDRLASYRGTWTTQRLTVVDVNGRELVFRRR